MSTRRRIRNLINIAKEHVLTMTGRYHISPIDFDELYQLYQKDTSAKGLYEFIIDHHITHDIARRMGIRPIDVLAIMVGKSADICQKELDAKIEMYQTAEDIAASTRAKAMAEARSVSDRTLKGDQSSQVIYVESKISMEE
ncbi:hypothetical protein F5Y11DRAFT_329107 [Daldinia sp. FL1419]|nr:hypothetical protein F5Y11DRAFT_329107 [Daldinia sp. FL1419]